jgi:hypothetical protein
MEFELKQPIPDYDGEGSYHADKCNGKNKNKNKNGTTNEGNCYKKEQERVNNYWKEFGIKMKDFWSMVGKKLSSQTILHVLKVDVFMLLVVVVVPNKKQIIIITTGMKSSKYITMKNMTIITIITIITLEDRMEDSKLKRYREKK